MALSSVVAWGEVLLGQQRGRAQRRGRRRGPGPLDMNGRTLCPSHVRHLEIGDAYDLSMCELTYDYSPYRRGMKNRQEMGQIQSWVAVVRCPRNSNSNDCLSARVSEGIYEGEGCEAARAREGK